LKPGTVVALNQNNGCRKQPWLSDQAPRFWKKDRKGAIALTNTSQLIYQGGTT
jgi:hypothetical protein